MVGAGDVGQENRPELAVVEQRLVEIGLVAVPGVVNGLQTRRRLQQQVGFQFARIGGLFRDVLIGRSPHYAFCNSSCSY